MVRYCQQLLTESVLGKVGKYRLVNGLQTKPVSMTWFEIEF